MNRFFTLVILSYFYLTYCIAQDTITYNVSFPNAVHHEAEISLHLTNIDANKLTAVMSKSSPGRYAIHHFGMNVYNLKAYNDENLAIPVNKTEPDAWEIEGFTDSLVISYTLYANYANGTYSGIDSDFSNLNIPATFLWIKGMEEKPVKVFFNLPDTSTWKISTQLTLLDSAKHGYVAPNLQYFMDSPCILSGHIIKEFTVGQNEEYTIRMAINSKTEEEEMEKFVSMTKKVVLEQKEIFGEFPEFENKTYTFLCSYGEGFYGDGMEHRNSTMISAPVSLAGNQMQLIGTISHEFFHAWNIERIRPSSLEPFDFTKANVSGELWFGEGFTSYYSDLVLCRAGLLDRDRFINNLSKSINYFMNAPGRKFGSPVYMSEMATYRDGGPRNDNNNFANTYMSYYSYGEMIALALDLSIRSQFSGKSLDDLMKAMWIKYGKTEIPYSNSDIEKALTEVCNDEAFATSFFSKYIYKNEIPDFTTLFDRLGYKLIKKNPGKPSLGYTRLKFEGDTAALLSPPIVGSALYTAGVNQGDLILSIDDQPVTSYPELNFIVGTRKVDDEINISYSHLGRQKIGSFKLQEDNQHVLIPKEKFSIRIKEEEEKLRNEWLNSKSQP